MKDCLKRPCKALLCDLIRRFSHWVEAAGWLPCRGRTAKLPVQCASKRHRTPAVIARLNPTIQVRTVSLVSMLANRFS